MQMSKRYLLCCCIASFTSTNLVAQDELPQKAQHILISSVSSSSLELSSGEVAAKEMRLNAVAVEAYSWGIQEGVYYRTNEIQAVLNEKSFIINKTVNFAKFIIDSKMLMPTVLEAERIYVKNSDREARTVNMSYTLDKPPRIVSQVPSWRDYLTRTMPKPIKPIANAYPRNKLEKELWFKEFKRGWFRGTKQADSIFESDKAKLHKEIAGLYRFRFLLAQNIVTLPKLVKNKSSVMLLESGKTINLNDVKYTIQLDAKFNKVTDWKPVFNRGAAHEK